jgi:hypothetical protein
MCSYATIELVGGTDGNQRTSEEQPILAVPTQGSGEVQLRVVERFTYGKRVGETAARPE